MSTVADKLASHRQRSSTRSSYSQVSTQDGNAAQDAKNTDSKNDLGNRLWLWGLLDFDKPANIAWLVVLRLTLACTLTWNHAHPDQLWQATQVAYNWVYGGVYLPWEWSTDYQLRNAVYPAYLAAPLYALK